MCSARLPVDPEEEDGCSGFVVEHRPYAMSNAKELILQFQKMKVTSQSAPAAAKSSCSSAVSGSATAPHPVRRAVFKAKNPSKRTRVQFSMYPSKLSAAVLQRLPGSAAAGVDSGEQLFHEFSVACSKELDFILTRTPSRAPDISRRMPPQLGPTNGKTEAKIKKKPKGKGHDSLAKDAQKKSCAEQARNDDIDVDILADFLQDSIVFPRKMSYMAEMMYT